MKVEWGKTMDRYIASSRNKLVFVLLDIRRIPSQEDIDMLVYLDHHDIPFKIIFTKMDKVSNNEKFKLLKDIKKKVEFHNDDVPVSYTHLGECVMQKAIDLLVETAK